MAENLEARVTEVTPEASFRAVRVDGPPGAQAIARALRKEFRRLDADVVFIGSDDAGSIVTPVSSVGSKVASEHLYDVHIVRSSRR